MEKEKKPIKKAKKIPRKKKITELDLEALILENHMLDNHGKMVIGARDKKPYPLP